MRFHRRRLQTKCKTPFATTLFAIVQEIRSSHENDIENYNLYVRVGAHSIYAGLVCRYLANETPCSDTANLFAGVGSAITHRNGRIGGVQLLYNTRWDSLPLCI